MFQNKNRVPGQHHGLSSHTPREGEHIDSTVHRYIKVEGLSFQITVELIKLLPLNCLLYSISTFYSVSPARCCLDSR